MESPSRAIRRWLSAVLSPEAVRRLQDQRQEWFDKTFDTRKHKKILEEVFAGKEFLNVSNEGKGSVEMDGVEVEGYFHGGELVGNVSVTRWESKKDHTTPEENQSSKAVELCFCKKGSRHGFSTTLRRESNSHLETVAFGAYSNGDREGFWWDHSEGGGYLVRYFPHPGAKRKATRGVFLYPDLETAVAGEWTMDPAAEDARLSEGAEARVVGLGAERGVPFPVLKVEGSGGKMLSFEGGGGQCLSLQPVRPDPYETVWVEVRPSEQGEEGEAGEGLFCRRALEEGQVAAYFQGVRKKKKTKGGAGEEEISSRDYSISFGKDEMLDIPAECRRTDKYCATLGHKVRGEDISSYLDSFILIFPLN